MSMTACESPATPRCYAGIDPSLTGTGVCVLMDGEKPFLRTIVTTSTSHKNIYDRIEYILISIEKILFCEYDFRPTDVICIELPFVNPDPKRMNGQQNLLVLSYLIREALYRRPMRWLDVPPTTLKKFVCGKGNVKKEVIMMEVLDRWKIKTQDDNQADACGLAHMAKAVDAVRGNGDRTAWRNYQLEAVRDMLAKG